MHRLVVALVAALPLFSVHPAHGGTTPVALFDQGHGQRFLVEGKGQLDLTGLADVFREAGYEVRVSKGKRGAGGGDPRRRPVCGLRR